MVDAYKKYISELRKDATGKLQYKKGENINLGRKALLQAVLVRGQIGC